MIAFTTCTLATTVNWTLSCLLPSVLQVVCVGSFSQTLRRYTSLNHLAQAARAVLQNSAQINQMLSDLNRVDFTNVQVCTPFSFPSLFMSLWISVLVDLEQKCDTVHICPPQEQASWVCQCEDRVVQRLEQDFKMTLQQQNSLEQWATWLDGVVSQALKPYEQNPVALPKAAKVFLLNWSFYRWGAKEKHDEDKNVWFLCERWSSISSLLSHQFYGNPWPDSAQCCQFWLLSPDPLAVWWVHVLPDRTQSGPG